jgi:outer membrane receptor for ferrienterochelin and colicins
MASNVYRICLSVAIGSVAQTYAFHVIAQAADPIPYKFAAELLAQSSTNQNTSPATESQLSTPQKLEKVEVLGSAVNERKESTAARLIVTREDIARFGDTTVADVLRRVPGVTISGVPGRGGEIRMRGLGNGYTQILLNGEPTAIGFSIDSLSPDIIERIEVSRVLTADQSAQAIAGSINVILKTTSSQTQKEIKIGLAEERGEPSVNVSGQMSDRDGRLLYTLTSSFSHEKRDRPAQIEELGTNAQSSPDLVRSTMQNNPLQVDSVSLFPRVNLALGESETLSAESFIRYQRSQVNNFDRTETTLGLPPLYSSNDLFSKSNSTTIRSKLNWVRKTVEGQKIDVKLGINYNNRASAATFAGFNQNGAFILDRQVNSNSKDKSISFNGKYNSPYAENHSLAFGWDIERSQRGEDRIQREVSPTGLRLNNIDEVYDASVLRSALFAQDEWEITPRWSSYLGLRWEGLNTQSEGNVITKVANRSSVWSPAFQTVWKIPGTKSDQIRFGLTRSYKAPNTTELIPRRYIANNNSATDPDTQGNPDLRPELAWGLDAAYEKYWGEGGMFSASLFSRRITRVILQELSNVNGTWITRPVNNGDASVQGIELEAKFGLRTWLKTAPAIDLKFNIARAWSRVDAISGPNNRLDRQTPFSSNLGFDYKLDGLAIKLGGNFSFQNGGLVKLSETQNALTGVKRVLDLYGVWTLDTKSQFRLAVNNILRQNNIAAAQYFHSNGSLLQTTISPTSATIRATYEQKF